jgi:hypothetical protein
MCDLDDTSMKRKDNVVELVATHLHQSAIAKNRNRKAACSRRRRGGEGCGKRKAKKVKEPEFYQAALRSIRDILAARHVTLSPFLRVRASLRSPFIFFTN